MLKILRKLLNSLSSMSFKDVANMAIKGEFTATFLNEFIDLLIKKNKLKEPSKKEIDELGKKIIRKMQEQYPNAGIILKEGKK